MQWERPRGREQGGLPNFPALHVLQHSPDVPSAGKCTRAAPAKPLQPSGIRAAILVKSACVDFLGKQKQDIESKQLSKIEWCNDKLIIWEWLLHSPLQRSIYSLCELVILPSLENLF